MNIITIMSDEHSQQMMQFIDHSVLKTPNLDKLAGESTVFTNCYSPCPLCAPARASYFTGRYVNRIGTWDNATPYDGVVEGISHQFNKYQKNYICMGKTHFHHEGEFGFHESFKPGYMVHSDIGCFFREEGKARIGAGKRFVRVGLKEKESFDDQVLDHALTWLEEHGTEKDWMLYVGFLDPHFPFYVEKEHWDYFNALITTIPEELKPPFTSLNGPLNAIRHYFECEEVSEETIRKILVGYCCAIQELDIRIGQIMDKVEELGIKDELALIYTSDHGEQSGYHGMWWKCTMFQESANIPLIIRVPNEEAKVVQDPVNLVDLFPTVCDLMEIETPDGLDGESLLPIIKGEKQTLDRDYTFSEYSAHGIPNSMFMIRWKQYKYVYFCYDKPQLFDLESDPKEAQSLIGDGYVVPEVAEIARECHKRLLEVCDPYEVDLRAKRYQNKIKKQMRLEEYTIEMADYVPHPEHVL